MPTLCLRLSVSESFRLSSVASLRMNGTSFAQAMSLSGRRLNTRVVSNVGQMDADGEYFYKSPKLDVICGLYKIRSQSRMKGEYLFYEEKVETTEEEKQAKAARRYINSLVIPKR